MNCPRCGKPLKLLDAVSIENSPPKPYKGHRYCDVISQPLAHERYCESKDEKILAYHCLRCLVKLTTSSAEAEMIINGVVPPNLVEKFAEIAFGGPCVRDLFPEIESPWPSGVPKVRDHMIHPGKRGH